MSKFKSNLNKERSHFLSDTLIIDMYIVQNFYYIKIIIM